MVQGWETLDPLIAIAVAGNIVVTGVRLVRRSAAGLMDHALPAADLARIHTILDACTGSEVQFHALRTRRAGRRSFVTFHLLTAGSWSVRRGHELIELIEVDLHEVLVKRDRDCSPRADRGPALVRRCWARPPRLDTGCLHSAPTLPVTADDELGTRRRADDQRRLVWTPTRF